LRVDFPRRVVFQPITTTNQIRKDSSMKNPRIPSLVLAVVLQVLPVTRVFMAASPVAGSSFAIVSAWIAGTVALLGSYDAVSGASTTITSPTTAAATNGAPFTYRVTTAPDAATLFAASNLPPGLTISTTVGRITGTPTNDGVFVVLLTASDNARPDRTVTANLTLTVKPAGGGVPVIAGQPQGVRAIEGASVNLSVTATGPAPLRYLWRRNGAGISGATNSSLILNPVSTNQAGSYTVQVVSAFGGVLSSNAVVSVMPSPRFTSYRVQGDQLQLGFVREAGASYEIQVNDLAEGSAWQQWTNWPSAIATTNTMVTASISESTAKFYQIKMTIP
jgi:Immunoglobulin domain/Putative Ig domain